jgi:hypothetical protein
MITATDQTRFLQLIADSGFALQNKLIDYIETNIGWNHAKQVNTYLIKSLAIEFNLSTTHIAEVVDKITFATDVKEHASDVDALEYIMFESNPWLLIHQVHDTYNLVTPQFDLLD